MAKGKSVRWEIDMMECGGDSVSNIVSSNPYDKFNRKKMLEHYHKAKKEHPDANLWFVGVDEDWNMKNIYYYEGCGRRK